MVKEMNGINLKPGLDCLEVYKEKYHIGNIYHNPGESPYFEQTPMIKGISVGNLKVIVTIMESLLERR